jgi:hypothetical protein
MVDRTPMNICMLPPITTTALVQKNRTIFEATVSTNDTITLSGLSLLSAVLMKKSDGTLLTATVSGSVITVTQATQTNVDVHGIVYHT